LVEADLRVILGLTAGVRRRASGRVVGGGGSAADVHGGRGVAAAEAVEADRLAAGVVVQPDAVAEQDRCDVQVDLVDQPELEKLAADRGREHLDVLAAGRRQRDPYRLGRVAIEEPGQTLEDHRDSAWIAGCEHCRREFVDACDRAGFTPRIAYTSDDVIVEQALVAAGMGVTTMPGLALRTHRAAGIEATAPPDFRRRVYLATYGDPPDPPATTAFTAALQQAVQQISRGEPAPAV
jgi:hypothetical protein